MNRIGGGSREIIFLGDNNQNFRQKLGQKFAVFSVDHEKKYTFFENKTAKSETYCSSGFSHSMPSGYDAFSFSREYQDDQHKPKQVKSGMQPQYYPETVNPNYENWNSSQTWMYRDHTGNYENLQANPPYVSTTAYNSMNNNYSSIPPPPPPHFSAFLSNLRHGDPVDAARQIAILEGQLSAYKDELERKGNGSFTDNLKKFYNQIANVESKRNDFCHFMKESSPLSKAVSVMLKDCTLVSHLEDAIIKGKEIRESNQNKKVDIELVHKFKDILNPLKLNEKLKNLEILISGLEELKVLWHVASDFSRRKELPSGAEYTFEEMCLKYSHIKRIYFENLHQTDKAVANIHTLIERFNNAILNVFKRDSSEVTAPTDFFALKDAFDEVTLEDNFTTQIKNDRIIEKVLESVLKEALRRRKKIREVMDERRCIESISLEGEESFEFPADIEKDEGNLGTLLDFVRASKKMSLTFKYMVVDDIFKELLKNHKENRIYFYVNPANILIKSGATLCSQSYVTLNEPIPPFQFLAPECHSLQPDILTLYRGKDYAKFHIEDSVVGPAADCYSLGQLIQWIYCADAPGNEFPKQIISVMESHPVLRKLIDPTPKERPSLEELNEQGLFKDLLKTIFGECDFPDLVNQDLTSKDIETAEVEAIKVEKNFERSLPSDVNLGQLPSAIESQDIYSSPSGPGIDGSSIPRVDSVISLLSHERVVKYEEDDFIQDLSDPSITDELTLLCSEDPSD